jgi:hypothetical protein
MSNKQDEYRTLSNVGIKLWQLYHLLLTINDKKVKYAYVIAVSTEDVYMA